MNRLSPPLAIRAPLRLALALVLALLLAPAGVIAQGTGGAESAAAGSLPVIAIRVEGNRRVEAGSILQRIRTKSGAPYDPETLDADIRRVWRLGFFDDLQVDARPSEGGIELVFMVHEKPSVAAVRVEGNDELSEDDIREVIDVKKYEILDVGKIARNAEKIRSLYLEKGFYLAEVDHRVVDEKGEAEQVEVVFRVREYAKVEVKRITFLGNEALEDEELQAVMATRPGGYLSFLTSFGTFKEDAFEADLQRLTLFYYDKGYVEVKVSAPTVRLSRDKRYLYITIPIEEGERFRVGEVSIAGDELEEDAARAPKVGGFLGLLSGGGDDDEEKSLEERTKLDEEEFFSLGARRRDEEAIAKVYRDAGYAYVNVNAITKVRPDDLELDVTYDIQKGKKVYYGRIEIEGNTKTRDEVIRRELLIEEGALSNDELMQRSKARVTRLGFFESVDITTERGDRDDVVDVVVRVSERPTGTVQAGAGFSSAEQFLFNAQVSQNNFLGRGQVLSFQAQFSRIRFLLNARFSDPYFLGSDWRFSTSLYNFDFQFPDFNQRSTGGNLTFGYPLLDDLVGARDLSVTGTYKLENVSITPVGAGGRDARQIGSLFRGGLTSSVALGVFYDSRNNQLFPTSGTFDSARVEYADDQLTFSNTEFAKYDAESRVYFPLPWQFVLRLNGQLGYVTNIDPNKAVPLQERYLVGGPNTVRGFRRFSLGPARIVAANSSDPGTTGSRFRLGGNKQLLLTAEIERPILQSINLSAVLFADAGNAFGDDQNYTLALDLFSDDVDRYADALRTAVGFGFRWFSPLGLLRFEWGIPLARLRGEQPVVFEFTIGNAF